MNWQHIIDKEQSIKAIMEDSDALPDTKTIRDMQKEIQRLRFTAKLRRLSLFARKLFIILIVMGVIAISCILGSRIYNDRIRTMPSESVASTTEEPESVMPQEEESITKDWEDVTDSSNNDVEKDNSPTNQLTAQSDKAVMNNSENESALTDDQATEAENIDNGKINYLDNALPAIQVRIMDTGNQELLGDDTIENLCDGRYDTCWSVPISSIVGNPIIIYNASPSKTNDTHTFYDITGVVIVPGDNTDEESFVQMGRPTELKVHTDIYDKPIMLDLSDYFFSGEPSEKSMVFKFDKPFRNKIGSDSVLITINGFEPGTDNDELCISELYLCGTPREKY